MGGARFTVQALRRAMFPRVYSGKVYFLPANVPVDSGGRGPSRRNLPGAVTVSEPLRALKPSL